MIKTAIPRKGVARGRIVESPVDRGRIEAGSGTRAIGFETYFADIYASGAVQYRIHHSSTISLSVEG
jgi:hypothetical protein